MRKSESKMLLKKHDVLAWRLAGVAVWQIMVATSLFITYKTICHSTVLLSPFRALSSLVNASNWITLLSFLIALIPASAAHTIVLTTLESPSKHILGLQFLPTPLAIVVRKTTARVVSSHPPQRALVWIAFVVAHTISAAGLIILFFFPTSVFNLPRQHRTFFGVCFPFLVLFLLFLSLTHTPKNTTQSYTYYAYLRRLQLYIQRTQYTSPETSCSSPPSNVIEPSDSNNSSPPPFVKPYGPWPP